MKAVLLVAAAVAALSAAACNRTQQDTESTATTPAPDVVPAAAGPATAEAAAANDPALPAANTAAGFVTRAALSDMYEIESSRLALAQSQSNEVKRFAQMMIDAHTGTTREALDLVRTQNLSIAPPPSLDRAGSDRIADLRSAAPTDFDDRYIDQQTEAHQRALTLMRDYERSGDNAAFRTWAGRTATAIEGHLTMARALDAGTADDAAGATESTATTGPAAEARNDGDRNPAR